jgi:predicted amidohydrolase
MAELILAAAQAASTKGDIAANVARHLQFVERAAEQGVQLLVFPELSLTGYEREIAGECVMERDDERLAPLRHAARHYAMTIVAGGPLKAEPRPYLAAFVFPSDGRATTYAKRCLYTGEDDFFQSGLVPCLVDTHGERVANAICYDLSRPEFAAEAAALGATVYAAGVFNTPAGVEADLRRMSGYAREHKLIAIVSNHGRPTGGHPSGGRSAIWNECGELVVVADADGEALIIATRDAADIGAAWRGAAIPLNA